MTEEELLYSVGANIKKYRKQKGILQQDLAAWCNMEIPNISRIENGKTNPTLRTLQKISLSLGVEIADLVKPYDRSAEEEKFPLTESRGRLK